METTKKTRLFLFELNDKTFALYLDKVKKVLPLVEITFVENASGNIIGVINLWGEVVPIVDSEKVFKAGKFKIGMESKIVVANAGKYSVGFIVDKVFGYKEVSESSLKNTIDVWPDLKGVKGVARLSDGDIVLIYDVEEFLSLKEVKEIQEQIKKSE